MLADLSLTETVTAGALNVLFTALLVGGLAALVVKRYEARFTERAALRETYASLLKAQRESREASLDLARAGGESQDKDKHREAVSSHGELPSCTTA
jgi:hypothetical protein